MIKDYLSKYFGFDRFLPGQEKVINLLIKEESAAAIFPTGAGKSLCYQLPALILKDMTLVVSPLLSLMKDQIDFLKEKKIPAAKLDSTMEREEQTRVIENAKQGKLKILMISVERFRNERFRIHLKEMKISLLVVDEAHCISEWGHNFRPDYLKIPVYRQDFNIKQVLLLTATATPRVIEDMSGAFGIPKPNVVIEGFYRDNLYLRVTPSGGEKKDNCLLEILAKDPKQSAIVYVTLQKTAEKVARMLRSKGIDALPYHAGLKNEEREKIQDKFMAGEIPVIAATIAFGMGIDKRDIRRIIHYNLPKSLESYSQEIGRAGRDGQPSLCETLADRDSISILENFVYGDTPEEAGVKIALEAIRANQGNLWEVKLRTLSTESDIRQLPLKTLLVYLELEKIIKPRYTYFQDYEFKFITGQDEIIARLKEFRKEISEFAGVIFKHIFTKKIWSTVDIDAVVKEQSAPRERVIKALEYFGEQGWIELRSKIAIDVYEIMNHDFDIETLSAKLLTVFEKKETTEIERIHKMVAFFAGKSCLSAALSGYFGELGIKNCGRCSVCKTGPVVIPPGEQREPLTSYNYNELAKEFTSAISEELSPATIAKFFCGISSPLLTRNKAKKIRNFGILEDYPFKEVKKWVHKQGDF